MKRLYIFFILVSWVLISYSQINWINYENSGQFNDAFSAIAFDKNNNPWAGTLLNGVHYFNGTAFQNYNVLNSPILHDKIYDIIFDEQNNQLFIATLRGLTVYKEGIWTNYTTENSNLPTNVVFSFAKETSGKIWIGTESGVLDRLNGTIYNSLNTPMKGNSIYHICIDSKGNKWFATEEEIARFDGDSWQIFSDDNSVLPNETALCITEDTTGTIWASFGNTYSGTLATFDGLTWSLVEKNILSNLSSRIRSIVALKDGSVWFGTHDKGLIRYKDSGWSAFTTDNSNIPINQIIRMKSDPEDNLWLAHRNGLTKVQTDNTVGTAFFTERKLLIVPNPMVHYTRIFIPESNKKMFHLLITDMKGQQVRYVNSISDGYFLERKNLISGVYLLKLYNPDQIFQGKLIVK